MFTPNHAKIARQKHIDVVFEQSTRFLAFIVLMTLMGIIASLFIGAWPSFSKFGLGFLSNGTWDPVAENFGALHAIYGTLITASIALLIAVPVSFGIAIFLTELCPTILRRPLGMAIELLAGIPSIIYGMWGLFIFAPWFADNAQTWMIDHLSELPFIGSLFAGAPMGIGIISASLILSIMIIPFIASVMRDVFAIVPPLLKESSYALGSTTWEVVRHIVLPYTKTGVIGGIMLGLGRALGETMAVTFVIGNSNQLVQSLFDPSNTIASTLANEFAEANGELYLSSLIHLGLALFLITFIVLSLSKLLLLKLKRQEGH